MANEKCVGLVRSSGNYWSHPCGKLAKVERNGKWYCGLHDPVPKAERTKKRGPSVWEQRLGAQTRERARQAARDQALRELVEAAKAIREDFPPGLEEWYFDPSENTNFIALAKAIAKAEEALK